MVTKGMKNLIAALLILLFSNSVKSNDAIVGTGSYLLDHCKHYINYMNTEDKKYLTKQIYSVAYCQGYIDAARGVAAQMQMEMKSDLFKMCIPNKVRNDQLARIVTSYLKGRPDLLHWGAGTVVLMSLVEAFPCKID